MFNRSALRLLIELFSSAKARRSIDQIDNNLDHNQDGEYKLDAVARLTSAE
jgi:hypothetical protein